MVTNCSAEKLHIPASLGVEPHDPVLANKKEIETFRERSSFFMWALPLPQLLLLLHSAWNDDWKWSLLHHGGTHSKNGQAERQRELGRGWHCRARSPLNCPLPDFLGEEHPYLVKLLCWVSLHTAKCNFLLGKEPFLKKWCLHWFDGKRQEPNVS